MTPKKDHNDLPYRLGVGVLLLNRDGHVFTARRIDTEPEAWQMPQGGIDKDEDPRAAALRELEEETGITQAKIIDETQDWLAYDLPKDLRKKVWKGRFRGQKQKWYVMRFTGKDEDIDLNHTGHPEFNAWKWIDIEELPRLIVPFKRPLYEALVDRFLPLVRRMQRERSVPGS
ncbi:MAG: RNA pyrophosphohydrolase [Rhodospirillales bacterium]|nr:RNA pyrophosphohydrolase [Rhodospirillales bacterium]MCW8952878.1 RNA pyrophosphohydrolase [Rhodospirillales bacterium]MCW8970308.1 RNA pyrophosphohydrolase [Rhodospirillales bacterium]MCW9001994.1 RNA pyrophosphohydrolase [Rhodospirillales bacterium]